MQARMTAFVAMLLWASLAAAGDLGRDFEKDLHALQGLSDPQFDGGIRVADAALAARLAAEVQRDLGGPAAPCGQYNPLSGEIAGNLNKQADPHTLIAQLPDPLQALTQIALDGTPVQRAVSLKAIADVGTAARSVAAVLGSRQDTPSAWEAEALYATSCQRWVDGGIEKLVPAAYQPPKAKAPGCDSGVAVWLFDRAADRSRTWPGQFFETVWDSVNEDCGRSGNPAAVSVSAERIAGLKPVLLDPATDHRVLESLLLVLADQGAAAAPIAPDLIPLTSSPDEAVAWQAQRVIVSSGIPQAVPIFRHWLVDEQVFNWAWSDYIKGLAPYRDQLIPILTAELAAPVFSDRTAAAKGLGELQSPAAIPALLSAVSDDDWQTTQEAINGLAPYAGSHPEVHQALAGIAAHYWSPRIQLVAKTALDSGHGIDGDPFGRCAAKPDKGLGCIEIGIAAIDHHLPKCRDGKLESGKYRTADRRVLDIQWSELHRTPPPRGTIKDLSSWCGTVGSTTYLPVEGGWLAGCSGFEFEGALGFIPKDAGKPFQLIYRMGVKALVQLSDRIYVIGEEPLNMGDAGALDEVRRDADGNWKVQEVAALPSDLDTYSVIGGSFVANDGNGAVLFDPDKGISALTCQD